MKKYKHILFLLIFSFHYLFAQYTNVRVSNNIWGEESIKINPYNSNQIVLGVIDLINSNSHMRYCYSTNSGMSWSGALINTTLGRPYSDPVIIVDTNGNFLYISILQIGPDSSRQGAFSIYKSTNGGMNWNNGTLFADVYPKSPDMPAAVVDFSNSPSRNNIYVVFTMFDSLWNNPVDSSYVYFCRSTDDGNTFGNSIRISRISGHSWYDNTCPEGPVPAVGPNGEVYVCFPHDSLVLFNRSTNTGNTWLANDIVVSQQVGGWVPYHSPVIDCDLSNSPYRGNIYICFSDLLNGVNDRDIWFIRSTNGGNNWSTALRINNDSPGHLQQMPWICVDRTTGYIWIVFYDSRNFSTNSYADVFIARSTDGGNTFQNSKVSNSVSYTYTVNWCGDYIGISAVNNKVRPVWTKYVGVLASEVWTAIVDTFVIGIRPVNNRIPDKFTFYQNYPNPFNLTTTFKFDIPGESNVKLTIHDLLGREITRLINENLTAGTYQIEWNTSSYASGVYFYKLEAGNYSKTKKLVLLK